MINSSGLLGVITKITFRLYPKPEARPRWLFPLTTATMPSIPFRKSCAAAPRRWPSEFLNGILLSRCLKNRAQLAVEKGTAYLMIILTRHHRKMICFGPGGELAQICEENKSVDVQVATKPRCRRIFSAPQRIFLHLQGTARGRAGYHGAPGQYRQLLEKVDEVAKKYNTTTN